MVLRLVALLSLIGVLGTQPSAAQAAGDPLGLDPITLPAPLARVLRDYEAAWLAGDGARLAALFTDDGIRMGAGALPIKGRAALARSLTRPGGALELRAFAYAISDSVGYISGGYRYPGTAGPGGQFVLALQRGPGGRWLIATDIDNSAGR
ncbi:MAG: DUF4440 domain-containing protein [Gemmatimonadales bacterium]